MRYAQLVDWTRAHDTIVNRVEIINQLHDCRYDHYPTNPARLVALGGSYKVTYCGVLVASWGLYDLEGVMSAYDTVHGLQDVLWNGRRLGYMRLRPGGRT